MAHMPKVLLSDGSTCLGGLCESGVCILAAQDLASRLFTLFMDITIDKFCECTVTMLLHY